MLLAGVAVSSTSRCSNSKSALRRSLAVIGSFSDEYVHGSTSDTDDLCVKWQRIVLGSNLNQYDELSGDPY